MVSKGLLLRLEAKIGQDDAVEAFLQAAVPLVGAEPATTAWFALRFGRNEYGIFDVFPDEAGRAAHMAGVVAQALQAQGPALFASVQIHKLDVLAHILPTTPPAEPNTKAILLTFDAKEGHAADVEQFLIDGRALVLDEPDTTTWFAVRFADGAYGIFDTFADNGGRFKHLIGRVPQQLALHALTLLGSVPDLTLVDVQAEKR